MHSFLFIVLLFIFPAAPQDLVFYDAVVEEVVDNPVDEQITAKLHRLTLNHIAGLLYQDESKGEFMVLNVANLLTPYDWQDDFYEYTGLTPDVAEDVNDTGILKLLEILNNQRNLENQDVRKKQPSLLERLPRLSRLPKIVYRYIEALQTSDCVDFPFSWVDQIGHDCDWYAEGDQCDEGFVPQLENGGYDARQACCDCGGGDRNEVAPPVGCTNLFGWTNDLGQDCGVYTSQPALCGVEALTNGVGILASNACCACGYVPQPLADETICQEDLPGFLDSNNLACSVYKDIPDLCLLTGHVTNSGNSGPFAGISPNDACCACQDTGVICLSPSIPNSNALTECFGVRDGEYCDFECNPGFELVGFPPIFCDDGSWGDLPECHEVTCEPPGIPFSNAFTKCSAIMEGHWCFVECDPLYQLTPGRDGEFFPRCRDSEWTDLPSCQPLITCPLPAVIEAQVDQIQENCAGLPAGEFCLFNCNPGYQLEGLFPVCGEDGFWGKLPRCVPKATCSAPQIPHSNAEDCGVTNPGYECIFDCEDNYSRTMALNSVFPPLCLPEGIWTPLPYCEEDPSCPEPPILNSNAGERCTNVHKNEYCHFHCDEDYMVEGDELQCLLIGNNYVWREPFPDCVPQIICTTPHVLHGGNSCGDTLVGHSCEIDCEDGYQLIGSFPTCLIDSNWDRLPECELIPPCGRLQIDHSNCAEVCPSAPNGESCGSCVCEDGYEMIGDLPVRCERSEWQPPLPYCEAHSACDFPPVDFSNADEVCHGLRHGSVCNFDCIEGYEQVGIDLTCNDGVWEPDRGTSCKEINYCATLEIANSNSLRECEKIEVGEFCVFTCDEGYKKNGLFPECEDDKQWSFKPNPAPTCDLIPECRASGLQVILNLDLEHAIEYCDDLDTNEFCFIQCQEGYEVVGNEIVVCKSDGTWNFNQVPTCVEIEYCDVQNIENSNSQEICEKLRTGDFCRFQCQPDGDTKYERTGLYPRCTYDVSTEDLIWITSDESEAKCVEIPECGLPDIAGADPNSLEDCRNKESGEICEVRCREDYYFDGFYPECQADGTWTTTAVCILEEFCVDILPDEIPNSNLTTRCNKKKANELCTFDCLDGFELVGAPQVCLRENPEDEDLSWLGAVPLCREITSCRLAPNIPFSDAWKCSNYDNELNCMFECDPGYTIAGPPPRCSRGKWETPNLAGYFAPDFPPISDMPQCIVVTPEAKTNYLDRQLFTDDLRPFFSNYRDAIGQLKEKTLTSEEEELATELGKSINDYNLQIDNLKRDCQTNFDPDIHSEDTWLEHCRARYSLVGLEAILESKQRELLDVSKDDILELHKRVEDYEERHKYAAIVKNSFGQFDKRPNWITTPSPKVMWLNLQQSALENTIHFELHEDFSDESSSKEITTTEHEDILTFGKVNYIAAYSNTSEFQTIKYIDTKIDIIVDMIFRRWGRVIVSPDGWYTDSWDLHAKVAENRGDMEDGFTARCAGNSCGGSVPLVGKDGFVYTKIRELFVATDVEISIRSSGTITTQIEEIWKDASSVRIGPFCSGDACHTTGNVIIGGDDLTDHGLNEGGQNKLGWLYMEQALRSIIENTFRITSELGTLAVLGSSDPGGYFEHDAGSSIKAAAEAVGLQIWWYNGDAQIRQFFEELSQGDRDPQIIWIAGNGANNDLDAAEGDALTDNAIALHDFAESGGGLFAHGSGQHAYGWLFALLPNINEVAGCEASQAYLTDAGAEKFPSLTNNDIRAGPCHNHFTGDLGNLEVLAYDTNNKAFIIGGYGGIVRTGEESETARSQTTTDVDVLDQAQNHYIYKNVIPQIIMVFAPGV